MTARLATHVWVGAYLARLRGEGIFAHLAHTGDRDAGAVAVVVATMDGRASLWLRRSGFDGDAVWEEALAPAPEPEIAERVVRERRVDPDLWVVEVEDPKGRHLLGEPGL